jgi:hypothetical protein
MAIFPCNITFDYQSLLDSLKDYARPRDKITGLLRCGDIIRVKKGLYVFGGKYRRQPFSRELLANSASVWRRWRLWTLAGSKSSAEAIAHGNWQAWLYGLVN